jgi:NADPH-dependent curcumin reductase CurA
MVAITNTRVIFNEIPSGYPEPGKATVVDRSEQIDVETVELHGGILVKTIVLSIDPYMRGRMRDEKIESYVVRTTYVERNGAISLNVSCSRRLNSNKRGDSTLVPGDAIFEDDYRIDNHNVALVIRSEHEKYKKGDFVYGMLRR